MKTPREFGLCVKVNAIAPGGIKTNIWNATDLAEEEATAHRKAIEESALMKHFGEPQEIADDAYFVVGNQATYVSDQSLRLMALLVSSSHESEQSLFFYAFI